MLNHVADQIPQPLALMIARAFIMHIAKRSLDWIGFRAVSRQIHQLDPRMPREPLLYGLRFVDFVVIHHHEDFHVLTGRVSSVNDLEQINEQAAGFAKPDAVKHLAGNDVERPGQIVLFIRTRRHDFKLSAFLHPRISDLRQQVDVEFVSKQQELFRAKMLKNPANSREFLDALRVIIFGNELGAFPDPAEFMQPTAGGIGRDFDAAIDFELRREGGTTPACSTPAEGLGSGFEQSQQRAFYGRRQTGGTDGRLQRGIVSEIKAERMAAVSGDNTIDRRARAEQECSDLGRRAASGTKQQDVQSQQVTVARASELRKHLNLLRLRNVKYGRIGHSLFSETNRVCSNNRFIKENLSVPIS